MRNLEACGTRGGHDGAGADAAGDDEPFTAVATLFRVFLNLLGAWRLAVEARYLQRKLWIISRYASTLSTPTGVPRSTIARLPACAR